MLNDFELFDIGTVVSFLFLYICLYMIMSLQIHCRIVRPIVDLTQQIKNLQKPLSKISA